MAQTAYIFEAGSCLVLDGEELWLTGDYQPSPEATIHQQIEVSGAPAMLLQSGRTASDATHGAARPRAGTPRITDDVRKEL